MSDDTYLAMRAEIDMADRLCEAFAIEADRLGERCAHLEDLLERVLDCGWPLPQGLVIDIGSELRREEA